MKIQDIPAGSVVVGIDGSMHGKSALDWALGVAGTERRPVVLLHACAPMSPSYGYAGGWSMDWAELNRVAIQDSRKSLHEEAERVRHLHPDLRVLEVIEGSDPRVALVEASRQAHLLVVGSRGRGPVATALLGSVSVSVTRHAACPVVVVRPGEVSKAHAPVVAAIDGTPFAVPVLEFAFRHAAELDTLVRVVHCVWTSVPTGPTTESEARLTVAEAMAGLGEKYPDTPVSIEIVEGARATSLVDAAPRAALLVVGHVPVTGLSRVLYGSVAAGVLEHATCPVAVVPGSWSGHEAPGARLHP